MEKNKIDKIIHKISDLINQNRCEEALKLTMQLEKNYLKNPTINHNIAGFMIDIGERINDPELIKNGIVKFESLIDIFKFKPETHYNLASGYSAIYKITEYGKDPKLIPRSKYLQKAKFHYRKALEYSDKITPQTLCRIWTNYGNCLDSFGRSLDAMNAYDKAIRINPKFSMALASKAVASCFFADISGKYRGEIYIEAYQAMESIKDTPDLITVGGEYAREHLQKYMSKIEAKFKDKSVLKKKIKYPEYDLTKSSEFEKFYIKFCSKHKLFLNFCIHESKSEDTILDPIFINMLSNVQNGREKSYNLAKYINQIKENYMIARLSLVQSQYKKSDFNSISRRTLLVNTQDYSKFNIYIGLLKSAFKEAYDILDKIACFINEYMSLNLNPNTLSFLNLWEDEERISVEIFG